MARNKPKGWVKEPVRHGLAAKGVKTGRKPLPILAMAKAEAKREFEKLSPYGKHLALAQMAGFRPYSEEEFERRRAEGRKPIRIRFEEDAIYFHDDEGEIVMWTEEEWVEDPGVALIIANAAYLAGKGEDLRKIIRQGGI